MTFADRLFNLSSKRRSEERWLASKQTVTTHNRAERTGNSTCMLQEGRAVSMRGLCENFALTAARPRVQPCPPSLPYQIFQNRKEGGGGTDGIALAQRVKLQKSSELKESCAFAKSCSHGFVESLSKRKTIETKKESSLFRMLRNFRHQPWIPALVSAKKGNFVAKLF